MKIDNESADIVDELCPSAGLSLFKSKDRAATPE